MKIRNNTKRTLIVALRGLEGYDDREEVLKPGQETDDYLNLSDDIFDPEIITIEEVKHA